MRRVFPLQLALAGLALAACVTINVYFPAAAAEKAADQFTKEVLGTAEEKSSTKSPDKTSQAQPAPLRLLYAAVGGFLDLVVPPAHAQVNFEISTPEVNAIKESMKARTAALSKYFASGAVGLTADGMVDVRDQNLIPLPERTAVRKLLADENKDRNTLYAEIAKANGHPEWEGDIRNLWAERWIANAPGGWWHRDAGGAWKQK